MQKFSRKNGLTYYDSCYAHNCSVWNEKDVLEVDIKGGGCLSSLRRFWYNLFLLSYTDIQAKHFYTSSHAMKVARAIHFRNYRSSIHPLSKFRTAWDFLILHTVVVNKFLFHLNSSMIHCPAIYSHYLALVCEVLIIFDVYLNFKTGHADKSSRKVFMDPRDIVRQYLSTTLCIHVFSAIPLEALMFLRYKDNITCSPCKCSMFIVVLRLVSCVGCFRLFEMSKCFALERNSYKVTTMCKFVRSVLLGMVIMMQMLTFADALSMLNLLVKGSLHEISYVRLLLTYRYNGDSENTALLFFALEFSRISKSFLLFGYGLHPNETTFDQMSALIAFVIAYMFHIWIFLGMNSCLTRMMFSEDMYLSNINRTMNFMRARLLPDLMNYKVREYYHNKMAMLTLTEQQNGIFIALPKYLKRDIILSCYRKQVMRLSFFADWPFEIINEIALLLTQEVFLEKDVVGSAYVPSDGLMIVEAGLLIVYSMAKRETCHLIDGDYFGELSLVTDKEIRISNIVAASYTSILFLEKVPFRKLMRNHPQLFFDMKKKLNEMYSAEHSELRQSSRNISQIKASV